MDINNFDFDNYIKVINNAIDKLNSPLLSQEISLTLTSGINEVIDLAKEKLISELHHVEFYKNEKDDSINQQYKEYVKNRVGQISSRCSQFNNNQYGKYNVNILSNLLKEIISFVGEEPVFELFQNFRYGNSNYILFGKNGSGKTTLLNELHSKMFNSNSVVIPATRNINYANNLFHRPDEINLINAISSREDNKTMFFLSRLLVQNEIHQRREYKSEELITANKVVRTFNSLGMERELFICENGDLQLFGDGIEKYSLSSASDGEKSALYFIMVVFLSPLNSFLIIDEPENHLNGSLMKKLFDVLENERKDIKFVYSTHDISFIESRNNVEIVYLKKSKKRNKWLFNKFDEYINLPLDIILNVEGTNDNVVFCEGESNNSFDPKLYQILFPHYQIVPSNGCEKVIMTTNLFNENKVLLRKQAFGIIDYDFREPVYIEKLKQENVYVLKVNEIENVFLLDDCLHCASQYLKIDLSVTDFKNKLLDIIKRKATDIKKDYAAKLLKSIHFKNKIDNIDDIEESLKSINAKNDTAFMNAFSKFASMLDSAILSLDYVTIMQIVPGKMIINDCAKLMGLNDKDVYIKLILKLLEEDEHLRTALKSKICDLI